MKTLGPDDLAQLLRRTPKTIRSDANRRPQSLPPQLQIPGSRTLVWLEADVAQWLEQCREKDTEK